LKESKVVSNLLADCPLICMQDPLHVRVSYILKHSETTGETIKMEDVPETMFGGALPIASKKKRKLTKEEYLSEAAKEAYEPKKNKAMKAKVVTQAEATGSGMPTIQEEVQDLEPAKVLNKRTRSGKEAEPSPPQPAQPASEEEEVE